MHSRSRVQKPTQDSSDRLAASIQPRPFSTPNYDQPQPIRHDFSHVDLFSHAPVRGPVQMKLAIGQPGDKYEQEADRVAAQVVNQLNDPQPQQSTQGEGDQSSYQIQNSSSNLIQRATVSGVRNDGKTAVEIGNDMHRIVQDEFIDSDLRRDFNLYAEFPIGGGRADLVAINDERDEDGLGDCYIYVGEIKSDSLVWYGPAGAHQQLDAYINAFRADPRFAGASVGRLGFWNPSSEGIPLDDDGYNCTLFIQNRGNGLYTYTGRVRDDAILGMTDRLDDQEMVDLPFNERPSFTLY